MIELYLGIGLKSKTYSFSNLPNGADIEQRGTSRLLLETDIDGTYPSLAAGFKLIYKIKE